MRIIILNGPPRSGKDTIGEIIKRVQTKKGERVQIHKFAAELKFRTHALYGLRDENREELEHDAYEDTKDEPLEDFFGLTPRQAYIAVAERLLRPVHGPEIFGQLLFDSLSKSFGTVSEPDLVVITDGGFLAESQVFLRALGPQRIRLFQIMRDGCTFDGDSRSYYEIPGVETFRIQNNGTLKELERMFEEWRG